MRLVGQSTKHIRQRMKYGKKTADCATTVPGGAENTHAGS